GFFAISNAPPGSKWEKVDVARDFLAEAIDRYDRAEDLADDLLGFLSTRRGGPIEREIFVTSPSYGTRSSTVILCDAFGDFLFVEQNYSASGVRDGKPLRYRLPFTT
ncbi:MAG TPA: NRDE family protein, partial [Thermoanaerobaculia bacterium]